MNYSVVIPAAGQGKRMNVGGNKQFLLLQGEPLIVHTVRVFQEDPSCESIILVANQAECKTMQQLMDNYGLTKVTKIVEGGRERQESVRKGLDALQEGTVVLIHDGARPFIKKEVIKALVEKAFEKGAAIVAVPVKDTVKRVVSGMVDETLKRSELWQVQTPQAFLFPFIHEAHVLAEKENFIGTDDASLVEWLGYDVHIVEGDYLNIKLTTKEDLLFAEAILHKREI